MKLLKDFFKQRETLLGISAAVAFQLIFVIVWLTGYDGVYERVDQFTIGVINEDSVLGEKITSELKDNIPFQVTMYEELPQAKRELDEKSINMLIHLPNEMTKNIQANENTHIDYYINQSVPTLTKQMMETSANKLNEQVNWQINETINIQLKETIPQKIAAESSNEEIIEEVASQAVMMMQENSQISPVQMNVMKTNDKEGFVFSMVPLLIVLASYIGAMLISQHLQFSDAKLKSNYNRFALFTGRQIINVLVATTISLLTVCLMNLFKIEIDHNFFALWGFQAILMFSFLTLSQVFVMLFGNLGMIFNIALTATQLVSSGAIVPRELLSSFYQGLGSVLPATYGVNSYFSLIYGGGDLASDLKYLWIIISTLLIIALGVQTVYYLWERFQLHKSPTVKN
ncbi:YhgE/Pip domain-containing protein [Pseudogracilibacillus sp. SO30301A]|uniref:YhgE/Pip domain-containing protein n=1 Tax=Pseudogracilibacillus sp. SO30301A TaxID=3098291 RepID=UPI00300DCE2D